MSVKGILFNTEMVRAILAGRKTATRRVVKPQPKGNAALLRWDYGMPVFEDGTSAVQPYRPGDILYVRESWREHSPGFENLYIYKADYADEYHSKNRWHPSIHMPREAARIWLRVTDVRVERLLHGRSDAQARAEGCSCVTEFLRLWDSTIKPAARARYGWAANPWVWVIEFERCEAPEEG